MFVPIVRPPLIACTSDLTEVLPPKQVLVLLLVSHGLGREPFSVPIDVAVQRGQVEVVLCQVIHQAQTRPAYDEKG